MRIGGHLPTRGGLLGAIEAARATGADAVQIFASNPRAWAPPQLRDDAADAFVEAWRASGLGPLFIHAAYLVNIASPNPGFRRRSVEVTVATAAFAERIGAAGVVVHAGAGGASTPRATALARAASSLATIATAAAATEVIVELTAGGAGTVASSFDGAAELIAAAGGSDRLALCADSCHMFAAGAPLDDPDGVAETFDRLHDLGLGERFRLLHANDSRYGRGQRRDSHTHIGEGHIGERGFAAILAHPLVRKAAVVCETPGKLEDHARNIATLRRLAASG